MLTLTVLVSLFPTIPQNDGQTGPEDSGKGTLYLKSL